MELDPVAELTVREIISNLGLIVVGWYHSHPKFQPDPSVTDVNNQQQYQNLMKDEISGIEPFVGLIVSTYDLKLPSLESHHQWFNTRYYSDGTRGKKPVSIPMLLETSVGIFSDIHHDIDAYANASNMDYLVKKLLELDPQSSIQKCINNEVSSHSNIDKKGTSLRNINSNEKKIHEEHIDKNVTENIQNQRNFMISKKRLNHRNVEKEVVIEMNNHSQDQGNDLENEEISKPLILKIGGFSKTEKRNNIQEPVGILGQKRLRNAGSESLSMRNGLITQGEATSSVQMSNHEKLRDAIINENLNLNQNVEMNVNIENKEGEADQGRNHVPSTVPLSVTEHSDDEGSQYIFGIKVPRSSAAIPSSTQSIGENFPVPLDFRAAGGSAYLGEIFSGPHTGDGNGNVINKSDNNNDSNNNNRNDGNDRNGRNYSENRNTITDIVTGKKKDNSKIKISIGDDTNVGRRSGRETKTRDLYVPEKEKIVKISVPSSSSSIVGVGSIVKAAGISIGRKTPVSSMTSISSHGNSSKKSMKSKEISVDCNENNFVTLKKKRISESVAFTDFLSIPISLKAGKGNKLKSNSTSENKNKSSSSTCFSLTNEKKSNGVTSSNSLKKSSNQSKMRPVPRGSIKLNRKGLDFESDSSMSSSSAIASKDVDNFTVTLDKRRKEDKLLSRKKLNSCKKRESPVQQNDKDESFFSGNSVPSQIVNGNEKEVLKKRGKGNISKSSNDVNSKGMEGMNVVSNIGNKEFHMEDKESNKDISILQKLQSSSRSSDKGRILLCSIHPNFRFLLLGIISLGFYYAGNPRRMDLNKIWKDDICRSEKLKGSIRVWACKLSTSLSSTEKLIDDIIDFLLSCWVDSDEEALAKPKLGIAVKKKKAAVCLHDGGNCGASHPHTHHVSLKQKFLIYKEDRGEIKVTKKRKKKKLLKEK